MAPSVRYSIIAASCIAGAAVLVWGGYVVLSDIPWTAKGDIRRAMWEEERKTPVEDTGPIPPKGEYFEQHASLPLAISNEDFEQELEDFEGLVLDAREIEEVAIGRFPNSLHIRYADIREGRWRELPTDKNIYVFCYSGVRGEIVATFLRERGIVAQYLEEGAVDWVEQGGRWDGDIDFYGVYTDLRYHGFLNGAAWQAALAKQPALVDTRAAHRYKESHVQGSVSLPFEYTPTPRLDAFIRALPRGKPIVTLCDDLSSCFDATLAGMRLEKAGHPFLGMRSVKDMWQ